jgi:seryl-tRNA synthetase
MIGGLEAARGVKVSGQRGYFLKNWAVKLNYALIQYGLDFLMAKNYDLLQTPFMMNKSVMAKTAQLEEFDEALYHVSFQANSETPKDTNPSKAEVETVHEKEGKYLIATSEQPISAFHMNETLELKTLPLKYAGISTCFRKEAGASGRDVKGIFRVHQFEKVEQFCITDPEKSWEMHEQMLKNAQEFYQSVIYRV